MLNYRTILGIIAIIVGVISYSFYFRDIFRGKTKPEAFSWLIWSLLAGITFFAQLSENAGPGAWPTAFTAVVCLVISLTVFFRKNSGGKKILDYASLSGALISIGIWKYTLNAMIAVVLVIIIGAFGFIPTFKKAFDKPTEETLLTYFLNGIKFALAFAALNSYSPITWLYPIAMVVMNFSLAAIIFWRRRSTVAA